MSILVTLTQPAGATGAIEESLTQLRASEIARPPHGGGASGGRFSSASDDDGGGSKARNARAALIKGAAYRQQLNFGAKGDQALDRIKYVHQMGTVGADRCYSNPSPPV
jgi:hypothetical protein